jgi:hypothetical protein
MTTLITFDLLDVKPLVTLGQVTLELLANHIETCAPGVFGLRIDEEGLFSKTLSGDIEEGRHYRIQECVIG